MSFLPNLNKFSYLKYFFPLWLLQHRLCPPHWSIYIQLIATFTVISKTEVTRKPHQRSFNIIENSFLLIYNSFMYPFNKRSSYVLGSIFGTVRHINSWKTWSLHIRAYMGKTMLRIYLNDSVRYVL